MSKRKKFESMTFSQAAEKYKVTPAEVKRRVGIQSPSSVKNNVVLTNEQMKALEDSFKTLVQVQTVLQVPKAVVSEEPYLKAWEVRDRVSYYDQMGNRYGDEMLRRMAFGLDLEYQDDIRIVGDRIWEYMKVVGKENFTVLPRDFNKLPALPPHEEQRPVQQPVPVPTHVAEPPDPPDNFDVFPAPGDGGVTDEVIEITEADEEGDLPSWLRDDELPAPDEDGETVFLPWPDDPEPILPLPPEPPPSVHVIRRRPVQRNPYRGGVHVVGRRRVGDEEIPDMDLTPPPAPEPIAPPSVPVQPVVVEDEEEELPEGWWARNRTMVLALIIGILLFISCGLCCGFLTILSMMMGA